MGFLQSNPAHDQVRDMYHFPPIRLQRKSSLTLPKFKYHYYVSLTKWSWGTIRVTVGD